MRQNPFYGLSVAAMLGGCYLVNQALKLEPGHLGKLVALIAVLQVYEVLLLGLGVFLLRSGRARRDGVMVLMLETLFLVDTPLLAMECVTADPGAGTLLSLALVLLGVGKLAFVRRALPGLLPPGVAIGVGVQAFLVFALPVAAVRLAEARLLNPVSLYGLWWLPLALPLVRAKVLEATTERSPGEPASGHRAWTWVPALSVVLHLWSIGWIHQVPFCLAYLTPVLLGLALASAQEDVRRQVVYPVLAVIASLGQSAPLGAVLTTPGGTPVSVLQVALVGAGATYAALAWRYGYRWLVGLAALFGVGAVWGAIPNPFDGIAWLLRLVGRAFPRTTFSWGVTGVVSAFALLALGAWRSIGGPRPRRDSAAPPPGRRSPGQSVATLVLLAGVLSTASALSAYETRPFGHPGPGAALGVAVLLAAVAFVGGVRLRSRLARRDSALHAAAGLGIASSVCTALLAAPLVLVPDIHRPALSESAVIGDLRTLVSAQAAYETANGGFPDGNLDCLATPARCLPRYSGPAFLDTQIASLEDRRGYHRSYHPGRPARGLSRTSVESYAYVGVPIEVGSTGMRGFCADSKGQICFTTDGSAPALTADGQCDLSRCHSLE